MFNSHLLIVSIGVSSNQTRPDTENRDLFRWLVRAHRLLGLSWRIGIRFEGSLDRQLVGLVPRGIVVVGGRLCVDLDTSRGIGVWFVLIAHRVGFDLDQQSIW